MSFNFVFDSVFQNISSLALMSCYIPILNTQLVKPGLTLVHQEHSGNNSINRTHVSATNLLDVN